MHKGFPSAKLIGILDRVKRMEHNKEHTSGN